MAEPVKRPEGQKAKPMQQVNDAAAVRGATVAWAAAEAVAAEEAVAAAAAEAVAAEAVAAAAAAAAVPVATAARSGLTQSRTRPQSPIHPRASQWISHTVERPPRRFRLWIEFYHEIPFPNLQTRYAFHLYISISNPTGRPRSTRKS